MDFVTISQAQGRVPVTIFRLKDRMNFSNAVEFEQTAREAYDLGARHMLLDLSELSSITSAGLRAILSIYKLLGSTAAEGEGGSLKLFKPTAYVHEVLSVAGVVEFIDIHTDLQEAIAAF
jgi:anti-anti-sigma factor